MEPTSVYPTVEAKPEDPSDDVCKSIPCSFPRKNWSSTTEPFSLRSATYLRDKRKESCSNPMFELIAMDLLEVDEHVENVAKNLRGCAGERYLRGDTKKPFLFIVHFKLPGEKKLSFAAYFAAKEGALSDDTAFSRLFHEFIDGTDEFRRSRFKFIPCVSKGPYIVKSMVGSTPAILGNKLTQTYHRGENHFEVCVDVGSSSVGGGLLKLVKGYLTSLTFDMCFLLEAKTEEELPEVMLGTLRFSNVDLRVAQKHEPSFD